MNDIRDAVDNICWKVDFIPDINRGGCCRFAARLGRRLAELGVPVYGIVAYGGFTSAFATIEEARTNVDLDPLDVDSWNEYGVSFNHVGLRFKADGEWFQCDSTGVTGIKPLLGRFEVTEGKLTVEELWHLSERASPGSWNDDYDTGHNVEIDNIIKEFLP